MLNQVVQNEHPCHLDREYKNSLGILKEKILSLCDPNEVTICAKWIQRFNQALAEEKPHRNKLTKFLIDQLAEDNLNYPFIFLKNLDKPLRFVDQELRELFFKEEEVQNGNPDELEDILLNMKQLLVDAQTMNLQVEEDLESIRSERSDTLSIKRMKARSSEYNLLLRGELRHLLADEIPKVIEVPDRQIICDDRLKQADLNWIQLSIEAIRRAVAAKFPVIPENVSKAVQTRRDWVLDDLEAFYERKFARLYTDSMLKDRAKQIQLKSRDGVAQIEQSRTFEKQFRRKTGKHTRK